MALQETAGLFWQNLIIFREYANLRLAGRPNKGDLTTECGGKTVIKTIRVCHEDGVRPITKELFETILDKTQKMVSLITGRGYDLSEISRRNRFSTWEEGIYYVRDTTLIISDVVSEECKEFLAEFTHNLERESYSIDFSFKWGKITWLSAVVKMLTEAEVECVDVIFDDGKVGKNLNNFVGNTGRMPIAYVGRLVTIAENFRAVILGVDFSKIWKNQESMSGHVGTLVKKIILFGLAKGVAESVAEDASRQLLGERRPRE
jgi:hypothetical protein